MTWLLLVVVVICLAVGASSCVSLYRNKPQGFVPDTKFRYTPEKLYGAFNSWDSSTRERYRGLATREDPALIASYSIGLPCLFALLGLFEPATPAAIGAGIFPILAGVSDGRENRLLIRCLEHCAERPTAPAVSASRSTTTKWAFVAATVLSVVLTST